MWFSLSFQSLLRKPPTRPGQVVQVPHKSTRFQTTAHPWRSALIQFLETQKSKTLLLSSIFCRVYNAIWFFKSFRDFAKLWCPWFFLVSACFLHVHARDACRFQHFGDFLSGNQHGLVFAVFLAAKAHAPTFCCLVCTALWRHSSRRAVSWLEFVIQMCKAGGAARVRLCLAVARAGRLGPWVFPSVRKPCFHRFGDCRMAPAPQNASNPSFGAQLPKKPATSKAWSSTASGSQSQVSRLQTRRQKKSIGVGGTRALAGSIYEAEGKGGLGIYAELIAMVHAIGSFYIYISTYMRVCVGLCVCSFV